MTKQKKQPENQAPKVKLTKRQKFDKYIMPVFTFIIGVGSLILILGLAGKGLSSYLGNLTDDARTIASIAGVSLLAYAVASLVRLFNK
jgi:hypothetical protein